MTSSWVSAQTIPKEKSPDPTIKRVELKKGAKAPFAGQLLSHAAVAKLLTDHKAELETLKLKIKYLEKKHADALETLKAQHKVNTDALEAKVKTEKSTCDAKVKVYTSAVDRVSKQCTRSWYESPYLNFALGAVVFGGISAGVGYVSGK